MDTLDADWLKWDFTEKICSGRWCGRHVPHERWHRAVLNIKAFIFYAKRKSLSLKSVVYKQVFLAQKRLLFSEETEFLRPLKSLGRSHGMSFFGRTITLTFPNFDDIPQSERPNI